MCAIVLSVAIAWLDLHVLIKHCLIRHVCDRQSGWSTDIQGLSIYEGSSSEDSGDEDGWAGWAYRTRYVGGAIRQTEFPHYWETRPRRAPRRGVPPTSCIVHNSGSRIFDITLSKSNRHDRAYYPIQEARLSPAMLCICSRMKIPIPLPPFPMDAITNRRGRPLRRLVLCVV
jgi:hypothetical protein